MKTLFYNINIIFILFFCFFGYAMPSETLILIILAALSIVLIISSGKIYISQKDIFFILFLGISSFSLLYSYSSSNTAEFLVRLWSIFIVYLFLKSVENKSFIVKLILLFSGLHVLMSYVYFISPNLIYSIIERLLEPESYTTVMSLYRRNAIAGITDQTGTNAYFITAFISILSCRILARNYNTWDIIFLVFAYIMLLFTQKRGLILSNLISLLFIFIIKRDNRKITLANLLRLALIVIAMVIFLNIPLVEDLLGELVLKSEYDLLGGRGPLFQRTINVARNNPVLGTGINTVPSILGFTTHNVYLQLLAEIGFLGLLTYVLFLIFNMVNVSKTNNEITNNTYKDISLYFQMFFIIYNFTGNPLYEVPFFMLYIVFVVIGLNFSQKIV